MSTRTAFSVPLAFIIVGLFLIFFGTSTGDETTAMLGWGLVVVGAILQFLPIFRRRRL